MKKNNNLVKFVTALLATIFVFGAVDKASAATPELTEEQKENYYAQYVDIVAETNEKYPDADLTIGSLDSFKNEEWVEPEEFKNIVIDMATKEFKPVQSNGGIQLFSVAGKTKKVSTTINGIAVTISVSGTFNTVLNNESSTGRQIFGSVKSLTSTANKGSWKQKGYTKYIIDSGRTCQIDVTGAWTYNNVTKTKGVTVEFYCSSSGVIS